MKCVCLQYIEAMVTIHQQNPAWKPERHIYLTFVPDEGAQGNDGCVCCFTDLIAAVLT